eukprot:414638_1
MNRWIDDGWVNDRKPTMTTYINDMYDISITDPYRKENYCMSITIDILDNNYLKKLKPKYTNDLNNKNNEYKDILKSISHQFNIPSDEIDLFDCSKRTKIKEDNYSKSKIVGHRPYYSEDGHSHVLFAIRKTQYSFKPLEPDEHVVTLYNTDDNYMIKLVNGYIRNINTNNIIIPLVLIDICLSYGGNYYKIDEFNKIGNCVIKNGTNIVDIKKSIADKFGDKLPCYKYMRLRSFKCSDKSKRLSKVYNDHQNITLDEDFEEICVQRIFKPEIYTNEYIMLYITEWNAIHRLLGKILEIRFNRKNKIMDFKRELSNVIGLDINAFLIAKCRTFWLREENYDNITKMKWDESVLKGQRLCGKKSKWKCKDGDYILYKLK